MPTANINILAVLVAAVLTFVLGAVWYSPVLFAKQWMAAQGYTPEKLEEMKRRGVTRAYAVSVLCYLVTARSEEHTSELQSRLHLVCRLLLEKKTHASSSASPGRSRRRVGSSPSPGRAAPRSRWPCAPATCARLAASTHPPDPARATPRGRDA